MKSRNHLVSIGLMLIVMAVTTICLYLIQFSTRSLIETDGYFHIKLAYLIAKHLKIFHKLPWLHYTIYNDNFIDHHFLYHILLIPFTFGDLRLGAKLAAWLFACFAFFSFYGVMAYRDRLTAFILTLLLLASGSNFLTRMSMTRVPSLSLIFMLLALHFIIARKYICLAVVSFSYVWLYDGFVILFPFMLCFIFADFIMGRRFDWRTWAMATGGVISGIIINPYFPSNMKSYVFNIQRVVGNAQLLSGNGWEWRPFDSWYLLGMAKVVWIIFAIGIVLSVLQERRSRETISLLMLAIFTTMLVMKARRYMDTWPPLVFLFAGYAWSDFWEGERKKSGLTAKRYQWLAAAILASLLIFVPFSVSAQIQKIKKEKPYKYYKGAAEYIHTATNGKSPPIVFNAGWDNFPYLFFFNSDAYYIVGLDQLYMKKYDNKLFHWWRRITSGEILHPSRKISEMFHASFVVIDEAERPRFARMAAFDPNLKRVYPPDNIKNELCIVYKVIP